MKLKQLIIIACLCVTTLVLNGCATIGEKAANATGVHPGQAFVKFITSMPPGRDEPTGFPRTLEGTVVGVHDGDTINVIDDNYKEYKIRLQGIDAPETKQQFGSKAKQNLSDMVYRKDVTIELTGQDQYKRFVGVVSVDGEDINLKQIKKGFAWHYKDYQKEQSKKQREDYSAAETKAKNDKLNLWSDNNPTPPWNYRKTVKN